MYHLHDILCIVVYHPDDVLHPMESYSFLLTALTVSLYIFFVIKSFVMSWCWLDTDINLLNCNHILHTPWVPPLLTNMNHLNCNCILHTPLVRCHTDTDPSLKITHDLIHTLFVLKTRFHRSWIVICASLFFLFLYSPLFLKQHISHIHSS